MAFQYKIRRSRRAELKSPNVSPVEPDLEAGLIQGKTPASKEEVWITRALVNAGLEFIYQYPIYGGGRLGIGGFVVDWLVYTPFAQAMEYFGSYWHSGEFTENDRLRLAVQFRYFGRETIVIFGNQVTSQESANSIIREKFR